MCFCCVFDVFLMCFWCFDAFLMCVLMCFSCVFGVFLVCFGVFLMWVFLMCF